MRRGADAARRHADATSKAMKRLAIRRRCPACQRRSAVKVTVIDCGGGAIIRHRQCRWCGWNSDTGTSDRRPG
jgi:hypothetical protein